MSKPHTPDEYERLSPHEKQAILRKSPTASFLEKLRYDALPRPNYAYATYHAALQAKALGLARISVMEFGVAGGNGLVELENVAFAVQAETGVEVDVYGFDTGRGMPAAVDHRDMPYVWQPGFFEMDVAALRGRLRKAKLVLGDVRTTVPDFLASEQPARIGFASVDLDYYSSTVAALRLFEADAMDRYLPRIFIYLDDIIGDDWELHSEFTGELCAVREFNEQHTLRKIGKINCLRYKRMLWSPWVEQMYVLHLFDHPLYNTYVNPKRDWQAPL